MESVLDVIIDPKGAQAGARSVNQALLSIQHTAGGAMNQFKTRLDTAKQAVFSLQSAIAAMGIAALARSFVQLGRELDLTERGLTTVATSAGQAALQMRRLREISDDFQLPDKEIANAFRLLASNGIPDAEKAIKTLGNAAALTGVDIETATLAMLAGQERMLRQLGISIVDLMDGTVSIQFGKMRMVVKKTDEEMRAGLLQIFESFPDATKRLATSVDFQLKRVLDIWDDFEAAVMMGGMNDFLATTFKTFADGFTQGGIKEKGEAAAKEIQRVTEMIARDIAVVIDLLSPMATLAFGILQHAFSGFNSLPPVLQTIGLFGALFFGMKGMLVLTAGLALADALGIKMEDIAAKNQDLIAGTPLGAGIMKGAELITGKDRPNKRPAGLSDDTTYIGLGATHRAEDMPAAGTDNRLGPVFGLDAGMKGETKSALETLNHFFDQVHANMASHQKEEAAALKKAEAERAAGASGVTKPGLSANAMTVQAQINKLRKDSGELLEVERLKQLQVFDPEHLDAYKSGLEFLQNLEQKGLDIDKASVELKLNLRDAVMDIFSAQGAAARASRSVAEAEEDRVSKAIAAAELLKKADTELRDLSDQAQAMGVPIADRDLLNAKLKLQRDIMASTIVLGKDQRDDMERKLGLMDEEAKKLKGLQLMEQNRLTIQEETARLQDETRDMTGGTKGKAVGAFPGAFGTTTPSRETLVNQREREFASQGLKFGPDERTQALSEIDNKLASEKLNWMTRTVFEMDQQTQANQRMVSVMGMTLDARQAELRTRDQVNAMAQKGHILDETEIQAIRDKSKALQESVKDLRGADAMNSFVDSFRVGWDTIERSGEQAWSHMEDGLTAFIQTGKMDFSSFVSFMESEMIRLSLRFLMSQAMQGLGGGKGGSGIMSMLQGGIQSLLGAGSGGGATPGATYGGSQVIGNALKMQYGGVFDYSGGRGFRSYYDVPGAQSGMVSHNERLIRISEGHSEEAVIPMKGGRVPVRLTGGQGHTIHAPITIITPDASGVRKSAGQIQAELSSALQRAAKRNS